MTAAELIEILQRYPPETPVVVTASEGQQYAVAPEVLEIHGRLIDDEVEINLGEGAQGPLVIYLGSRP